MNVYYRHGNKNYCLIFLDFPEITFQQKPNPKISDMKNVRLIEESLNNQINKMQFKIKQRKLNSILKSSLVKKIKINQKTN